MSKKDACYYGHVVAHAFSPTTRNLIFGAISSVPFFSFFFFGTCHLGSVVLPSRLQGRPIGWAAHPLGPGGIFSPPLHRRSSSTPHVHAPSLSFTRSLSLFLPLAQCAHSNVWPKEKNGGRGLSLSLSFVKEGGAMQQVCGAGCLSLGLFFFLNISLAMTCSLASWIVWVYRVLEKREGGGGGGRANNARASQRCKATENTHRLSLSRRQAEAHHTPHTINRTPPGAASRRARTGTQGFFFGIPRYLGYGT